MDEALEVVDGSSSEEDRYNSEEIPMQTPANRSKRAHGSSQSEGERQGLGEKASSKLRSKKKKRVARPLISDSDENEERNGADMDSTVKQPQSNDEMILNELKKTNQ